MNSESRAFIFVLLVAVALYEWYVHCRFGTWDPRAGIEGV